MTTTNRPAIGISGYAGAGKTEVARVLESEFGYTRRHIAEPLRRMLASLLREYGMPMTMVEAYLTGSRKEDVIPELGVTSRHCQITLGTEWGREQIGQDLWANLWARQAASVGGAVLNDSVRFPNEEAAIRDIKGFTILVERPGVGPAAFKWKRLGPLLLRWFGVHWGVHDSERVDRLRPTYRIVNDGSVEDLRDAVRGVMYRQGFANRLPSDSWPTRDDWNEMLASAPFFNKVVK